MAYKTTRGNLTVGDITFEDDTDTKIDFSANEICLETGGAERLTVNNDGIEVEGTAQFEVQSTIPTGTISSPELVALNGGDYSTALLLKFEGTNNSYYITDFSKYAANLFLQGGSGYIATAQKKWGSSSLRLQQSGQSYGDYDYVAVPMTYFSPPYHPFTVECWLYVESFPTDGAAIASQISESGSNDWYIKLNSNGTVTHGVNNGSSYTSSVSLSTQTWTHLAVVLGITYGSGGPTYTNTIYLDGTQVGTASGSGYWTATQNKLMIGYFTDGSDHLYYQGYIDDFRISATARYSGSSFSVPTATLGSNPALFARSGNGEMRRIS